MNHKKIILILCAGLFLSAERSANAQSISFNYQPSQQTWTVPNCVAQITLTATGAAGGGEAYQGPNYGGNGATMVGLVNVIPGHVLHIYTGGQGNTNYNYDGGAGGGGTFIYDFTASKLLEAAGGGGGSYSYTYNGYDASVTTTPTGQNGGAGELGGGCVAPDAGGGGTGFLGDGASNGIEAGTGGSDFADGLGGGAGDILAGDQLSAGGYGGGGGTGYSDGGGGGGYAGGGSGAEDGGGGGSSYVNGTLLSSAVTNAGNGSAAIAWTLDTVRSNTGNLISNVTCNGGKNGKASGIVTGQLPSTFTYSWAPVGGNKDTASGLSAGTYTLTVSSGACGHSYTAAVTITQPGVLSIVASTTANVLCSGGNNGSATSSATGGTLPYTYQWSPSGGSTNVAIGLSAGNYSIQVSDACGASVTAAITITQPNPLAVSAKVTANVDCHGNLDGSAVSTVSGGTLPYTFVWSPTGGNAANISGMPAGTYSVNVSDANGCTGSAMVTISQPTALVTSVATTANVLCNGSSTGSASSSTKGGTTPYNYAWTGGGTKDTLVGLSVGTYTLTITDAHGCVVAEATTITQPSAVTVIAMQSPDNGNCSGAAWVMVNGGVIPYTYLWSPGSQTSAYNYGICGKDVYCCAITDAHGCKQDICDTVQNDLGVANISSGAGKVTVYPNPNNGQFTIQSSVVSGQSSVEIYNVLGEKVFTTSLNAGGNTSININNQPNGVYLYRVLSNENGSLIGEGRLILNK